MIHRLIFFSLACLVYTHTQIFIAINLDTSPSSLWSSSSSPSSFVYFQIILIIRVLLSFSTSLYLTMSCHRKVFLIWFLLIRTVAWSTECNYRTYRADVTFTHVQSYRKMKTTMKEREREKSKPLCRHMYIWQKSASNNNKSLKKKTQMKEEKHSHMFKVKSEITIVEQMVKYHKSLNWTRVDTCAYVYTFAATRSGTNGWLDR